MPTPTMSDSKDNKGKAPQDTNPEGDAANPSSSSSSKTDKKSKDANPLAKITPQMAETLLENNPALKNEMLGLDKDKAAEALRKMDISQLLTGLSVTGKNQKDIASYKFWQTQPVPHFDETDSATGGPIKVIDPAKVSKEPDALIEGFEWATLDLTNETELQELWDLLTYHYVEDDNAMFRFRYSQSFLHW